MTGWRIETSMTFDRSIRKLDKPVARRIIEYLDALIELDDPRQRGRALSANRSGYWRYRVGDYRVLVQFEDARMLIVAVDVEHDSVAYGSVAYGEA